MLKNQLTSRAVADINNAALWYEDKQKGLGRKFTKAIRADVKYISDNPEAFPVKYKNIRTAVVSIFPYMIHYRIINSENIIEVIAVLHTSLSPEK